MHTKSLLASLLLSTLVMGCDKDPVADQTATPATPTAAAPATTPAPVATAEASQIAATPATATEVAPVTTPAPVATAEAPQIAATPATTPAPVATAEASQIAAKVYDIVLTEEELKARVDTLIQSLPPENAPSADQMDAAREMLSQQILSSFVQTNLIRITAQKEGVSVSDADREKAYAEFKVAMGRDFKEDLAKYPPSMRAIVEEEFETGILINALVEKNVNAKVKVDEAQVDAEFEKVNADIATTTTEFDTYYTALKDKSMTVDELAQKAPRFLPPQGLKQAITTDEMARMPKDIRVAIESTPIGQVSEMKELVEGQQRVKFYVAVTGAIAPVSDSDALTTITNLKKQIDEGASFETLAAAHSACPSGARAGGDLGEFSRGMMVKEFEDAAFTQPLNVIGDPVKTSFGYHLIKVTARDEAKGTAKASHILIATKKAGMEVSIVSAILPATTVTKEDIRKALIAREAQPLAYEYLDKVKEDANIVCPRYPNLFK